MNKLRRKEIHLICNRLSNLQKTIQIDSFYKDAVKAELDNIYSDIDFVRSDEECYMDNIPENLQGGYRYEAAEEACDNLENAMDSIYEAKENVNSKTDILKYIDKAIEYLYNAV